MRHTPAETQLVRMTQGERTVALGILSNNRVPRPTFGSFEVVGLNESPATEISKIAVEYNGLICEAGLEGPVHDRLVRFLAQEQAEQALLPNWREWRLPGCGPDLLTAIETYGQSARVYRREKAPYVELSETFADLSAYLDILSKNTRHQVRRSIRKYEERGALALSRPDTVDSATDVMRRLTELHQAQWKARGRQGAFSNSAFSRFHDDLLIECFEAGVIDLVEVSAGPNLIGVLYNFVHASTVSSYQSGFIYETDNQLKPGLVCHVLAISDYAAAGKTTYQFLAGAQRYKQSLSTGADDLYWVALQRPDMLMHIENTMRMIKAKLAAG